MIRSFPFEHTNHSTLASSYSDCEIERVQLDNPQLRV
jgi:hypothetical protein